VNGRQGRGLLLRVLSVAVGGAAGLVVAGLLLTAYVVRCRATHTPLDARLRRLSVVRSLLMERTFQDLGAAIALHDTGWFQTTWDLDRTVSLSRALFEPTTMYGKPKYRYRANETVADFTVWSGMDWRSFLTKPKPQILAAARRCHVLREVTFETDANGCKRSLPYAPGAPVVLFVGDSFTEGLHVASPDTFASRYGALARAAGHAVDVVNGGVNGYSALEEAWTVEHLAPLVRPGTVIANLFPNDVEADYGHVVRDGAAEASYANMFDELGRMADFCATRRTRLVVAALPPMEQVERRWPRQHWQDRVARWCARRRIEFVDPLDRFEAAGVEHVYLTWDGHLSEEGHSVFADVLLRATIPG
jgi:lysophospholipase L1-like esterase